VNYFSPLSRPRASWPLSCIGVLVPFSFEDLTMYYFPTRYAALRAFPNAIVRKVLNYHVNARAGEYVVFNDWLTYDDWKRCGHVK